LEIELCDSPPKLSGSHAPILAIMALDGYARVPGNLTRLSSSSTRTHHPKDLPQNMYITVIRFDKYTPNIKRKSLQNLLYISKLKFYMIERVVIISSSDSTQSASLITTLGNIKPFYRENI
jgi:hypothetical protein